MTPEGHTEIQQAFDKAEIPVDITPVPAEGQDLRFVTIRTSEGLDAVLNTLGGAGLWHAAREVDPKGPALSFVKSEVGEGGTCIVNFEDTATISPLRIPTRSYR